MAADNRTIKELSASGLANATPLCIQYPRAAPEKTDNFELKSSLLHHIPKFHGLSMEDPNKHLKEFEVVCSSMTPVNVDSNILKMKAFPFSLLEKAKDWLYELAPGTVTSWESMKRAFLEKFFPTSRVILLRKKISGIQQSQGPKTQGTTIYGVCSIQGHQSDQCPQLIENGGWESANAVGYGNQNQPRGNPFSSTYNQGWHDHPNFRWRDAPQYAQQSGSRQPPGFLPRPMVPQPPPQAQSSQTNPGMSMNDDKTYQLLTTMAQGMQNQAKEVSELKKQMGQMVEFLGQFRENGKLPSTTVVNPKSGFESAKAITLRSGKEVRNKEDEKIQIEEDEQAYPTARVAPSMPQPFKTSHPSTSDLGASINVMPYSIYASMNLGELKQDGVIIQLVDRSNAYPKGVLEDVLVQVNHLIFPADFYVLEMEDSSHASSLPILLGRPFMKTARTKIDVFMGTLTMEFDGDIIRFNLSETIKYPIEDHSCFAIDIVDSLAQVHLDRMNDDALEIALVHGIGARNGGGGILATHGMESDHSAVPPCGEVFEMVAALESLPSHSGKSSLSILDSVLANKLLPSIVQPPTLELKPLPSHLKYVFLGEDQTLPVIISSSLTAQEEDKLIRQQVEYLGHIVSSERVYTHPTKIKAIVEWPTPKNVKELRGFLGLTGYYRKLVPGYGKICQPLYKLTSNEGFIWTQATKEAFQQLKQAMTSPQLLALPNFAEPFVIECDASGLGIGAVLQQMGRPIAFASQTLGPRNQALSTYERELIAIVYTIKKWQNYLQGRHFIIKTDHNSLKYFLSQRTNTPFQQKWVSKLLGFDYEVQYRHGKENIVADALSRAPGSNCLPELPLEDKGHVLTITYPYFGWLDELRRELELDPWVKVKKQKVEVQAHGTG
ncbi:uncharacterized protein [Malus domestica]|uniref:uncharacterized protein n=1 Tax=Malus domestica TaxID=3750 RepID=UPI0039770A86